MHAGQARAPAGEAALTSALRGFSLSSASVSDDVFAKSAVTSASTRPAVAGGLAAALQRTAAAPDNPAAVGTGLAHAPPKSAAPVLLSASFRDRPTFLGPAISEEEKHDAALDSSDDEEPGSRRAGATAGAGSGAPSGQRPTRNDSIVSEEEEEDDEDDRRTGMRDEAAEELQL